jgi:outer membrane receptor protein involved in Fe transport
MVYEPNQDFNIKLLFGSAFRVPSFSETLIENPEEESSTEELHTFEVGFGYKPTEWLVAEVNYFNTEINELTEVTNGEEIGSYPIGTTQTYRTVGGFDAQGVEIELRGTSEKDINLGIIPRIISSTFRLNYSYQDTQDSQTHEKVPNMAKHKGNIGVGFNLSAEKRPDSRFNALSVFRTFSDELSLYFNLFLCGERERSTNDIRGPLPGYGVLDMTLTAHDVFHRGLDLSFSIKNMLDKEYYDPSPELTDIYSLSTIPDDYPNPGRTFYVELHYLF